MQTLGFKILLMFIDPFTTKGGGQTAIANIIRAHPHITFYYLLSRDDSPAVRIPPNAIPIILTNIHRQQRSQWDLSRIVTGTQKMSLAGQENDIALLLDMAASVVGHEFDAVEIPDFHALGAFIPDALGYFGVKYGKVLLSLHGALTLSLTNLWDGTKLANTAALAEYERAAYRIADIRYSISKSYLDLLADREEIEGSLLDPLLATATERHTLGRYYSGAESEVPNLVFVGRQDKIKGGDLFLEIVANLPRDLYRGVDIYGSEVTLGSVSSTDILRTMAETRGIMFTNHGAVSHETLTARFAVSPDLVFIPSRVDTFNLVSLEAILNGCPIVLSTSCGAYSYLKENYPELPLVTLDPSSIYDCISSVSDVLRSYGSYRARLAEWLDTHELPRVGDRLDKILDRPSQCDADMRRTLNSLFARIVAQIEERSVRPSLSIQIDDVKNTVRSMSCGQNVSHLIECIPNIFANERDLISLRRRIDAVAEMNPSEQAEVLDKLGRAAEHNPTTRSEIYKIASQVERSRGNDLLAATYLLRAKRLSGNVSDLEFEGSLQALRAAGLDSVADDVNAYFNGSATEVFDRLVARLTTPGCPDEDGVESVLPVRAEANTARVSIIVSVYNAAPKIAQFVRGLVSFTATGRMMSEVIFVDSGSSDDSWSNLCDGQKLLCEVGISSVCVRTTRRETIQHAWNRGLYFSNSEFVAFLGVDEMVRADAIEILVDCLVRNPEIDWAQGNGIVYEVNERGSFVRDVMSYNREFTDQILLCYDTCYISYVGSIYRRAVHDRVGYYNINYRAAGDTEFKNRALPFIKVMTLPMMLGMFRNFPEARVTESPRAELEDWSAWHLIRTEGGVRYQLQNSDATRMLKYCFNYRKTYRAEPCTDFELAAAIGRHLLGQANLDPEIEALAYAAIKLNRSYAGLDAIGTRWSGASLVWLHQLSSCLKRHGGDWSEAAERAAACGIRMARGVKADNRYHQHFNLWRSSSRMPVFSLLQPTGDATSLAGCQDLGEVLGACRSQLNWVDFQAAWDTRSLQQLRALFDEKSLDVLLFPAGQHQTAQQLHQQWTAIVAEMPHGSSVSVVIAGAAPPGPRPAEERVYFVGPCDNLTPVIDACRVIVIGDDGTSFDGDAIRVATVMLTRGKAAILSPKLLAEASHLAGAELANCAVPADGPGATATAILALLADDKERVNRHSESMRLWHQLHAGAGASDVERALAPVEWSEDIYIVNRALRRLTEQESIPGPQLAAIEKSLADPQRRSILRSTLEALFVRQDAPCLTTHQAINRKIASMPAVATADLALSRLYAKHMGSAARPSLAGDEPSSGKAVAPVAGDAYTNAPATTAVEEPVERAMARDPANKDQQGLAAGR